MLDNEHVHLNVTCSEAMANRAGLEVIELFSCPNQLSMEFQLIIKAKMLKNLKICFQIRILRVNNTYLTYTMDLHPVGEVLAFSSLSLPEKTFYLRTVRCLLQANPTKICHFHFGALKSPLVGGFVVC